VSISHTSGLAAAVASTLRLGLDVESIDGPLDSSILDVACDPQEIRWLESIPEPDRRLRALWRTWTAKEAVLKALHLGLTVDAREVTIAPFSERAIQAAFRGRKFDVHSAVSLPYLASLAVPAVSGG
jgi:4'-phosphopantetheinyl transferase